MPEREQLCAVCGKMFYDKSTLNRHEKNIHGHFKQKEKEETKQRGYTLKLCVMGKTSRHEMKTILTDAAILLKINLRSKFHKAEMGNRHCLIHFHGCPPTTLCQIRSYLGPMVNIIKLSFETKIASEILLEMKIHKNMQLFSKHNDVK